MKYFNKDFKTKLWQTIEEIEDQSMVEIVVIAKPRSASYNEVPLLWGIATAFVITSVLMFIPYEIDSYYIYLFAIAAFFIAALLTFVLPPMRKLFVRKKSINRAVEIMARAIFQKGKVRNTKEKIGVLFYVSLFEKQVYILPDMGAQEMVPDGEWEKISRDFMTIFSKANPAEALLVELKKCQPVFSKYIPPIENDINELPDNLEVEL